MSKQKLKLAQNLEMGVSGPSSQSIFFKIGGFVFIILSLIVIKNIYSNIKSSTKNATLTYSTNIQQKVLGAYDVQGQPQITNYTIQKGDTLFSIAQHYNTYWQTLATVNNLKAPYNLKLGSVIKIPISN